jgi:hypothetical protein
MRMGAGEKFTLKKDNEIYFKYKVFEEPLFPCYSKVTQTSRVDFSLECLKYKNSSLPPLTHLIKMCIARSPSDSSTLESLRGTVF